MNLILNQQVSNNENNVIIHPNDVNQVDVLDQRRAYPGASDQYSVITTRDLLEVFVNKGFTYERMWEQKYRTNSVRKGFGKHALRLRHKDMTFGKLRDQITPQFYLWNSYDRTMRFVLVGGMFVNICANTNAWGTHYFEPLRVLHRNVDFALFSDQIDDAVTRLQKTSEVIVSLQDTYLTSEQKYEFAERMARIRLGNNPSIVSVKNSRELVDTIRRDEERADTAWNIANRAQENLLTTNGNPISLTYSIKSEINDKSVELTRTTRTLRSEWLKNKINMSIFDVMKDVVDGQASRNELLVAA